MFEHKVDDHTTYIICDPDTAAWYNIFWLIGAIIKLCVFAAAALFAPVLILPLWGLNNSRDNTPDRGMGGDVPCASLPVLFQHYVARFLCRDGRMLCDRVPYHQRMGTASKRLREYPIVPGCKPGLYQCRLGYAGHRRNPGADVPGCDEK